jgi:hypothetical protein
MRIVNAENLDKLLLVGELDKLLLARELNKGEGQGKQKKQANKLFNPKVFSCHWDNKASDAE